MLFLLVEAFSKDGIKIGTIFEKCQKNDKISEVTPPTLCSTKFGSVPGVTTPPCAAISVG